MKGLRLFEEMTELDDDLILEVCEPKPRNRIGWKIVLLAAMVSMMAVTVFAAVAGRAEIAVTPVEDGYSVVFRSRDLWPVDVGYWYPGELPEGYEIHWIGSNEGNRQNMTFTCDKYLNHTYGDQGVINFTYGVASQMPDYTLEHMDTVESLKIGQHDARSFQRSNEATVFRDGTFQDVTVWEQWLFWTDAQKRIGFVLHFVGYEPVDLAAMAEGVGQVEMLTATYENDVGAAVMKLGNYDVQWLPEGYAYSAVYGKPSYPWVNDPELGYVHKVYRNAAFYELHLYYEYLPGKTESIALTQPELLTSFPIDLGGIEATYYETADGQPYAVVWQRKDTERIELTFTLRTDGLPMEGGVTREELIRMACSVELTEAADTTVPGWLK